VRVLVVVLHHEGLGLVVHHESGKGEAQSAGEWSNIGAVGPRMCVSVRCWMCWRESRFRCHDWLR
jgi:hypothetical protein